MSTFTYLPLVADTCTSFIVFSWLHLIHLLSLWDPLVCYAAYWGIEVSKINKISHIAESISYFCWMRMWNLNLYMKIMMLVLTKWRVQIKGMHFQRLSLNVLIFLAFTKNDFFFLTKFFKNLWNRRKWWLNF